MSKFTQFFNKVMFYIKKISKIMVPYPKMNYVAHLKDMDDLKKQRIKQHEEQRIKRIINKLTTFLEYRESKLAIGDHVNSKDMENLAIYIGQIFCDELSLLEKNINNECF